MATVTGLTAERMLSIEAAAIVDARIEDGELILTNHGGEELNLGSVVGPPGDGEGGLSVAEVQQMIDDSIAAAAGGAPDPVFEYGSTFDTDPLSDYTADRDTSKVGLVVAGGLLTSDDIDPHHVKHSTVRFIDSKAVIKWIHGSPDGLENVSVSVKGVDDLNYISLDFDQSFGATGTDLMYSTTSESYNALTPPVIDPSTMVVGELYALTLRIVGDVVTAEVWDSDPSLSGSPVDTKTTTLIGDGKIALGSGVSGASGFGFIRGDTPTPAVAITEVEFSRIGPLGEPAP